MTASLLPLPDDPRFQELIDEWPGFVAAAVSPPPGMPPLRYPRTVWLTYFEDLLRTAYPQSSSADRKLTARHFAPFPLAAGHDVP